MIEKRYIYKANAVGAAAHTHRIDTTTNLSHVVPALASSTLAIIGGRAEAKAENFCFTVDHPRKLTILAVRHAESHAEGRPHGETHRSHAECTLRGFSLIEQLHVEHMKARLESEHAPNDRHPMIRAAGNEIDGVRLGDYGLKVVLDEKPFNHCAHKEDLARRFAAEQELRSKYYWRFNADPNATAIPDYKGYFVCSLVKSIEWTGKPHPDVTIEGYSLRWRGFGRIFLGEILIGEHIRRLTMVRAELGSPAAGSASAASVDSNGGTLP